jgi:orotate phosphoribosyltransferase
VADAELTQLARDIDARCRLHGEFVLRSGQVAAEYFDKYLFEADPELLGRVARQMAALLPADTEVLGGLELGGVPLVTMLSQITGLPALYVRKQAKTYGTRKLAEGPDPCGKRVTLVEDVITTGGAVVAAAEALRNLGATVAAVVCAIDRSAPGESLVGAVGITVLPVLTKTQLDAAATQRRALQPLDDRRGGHRATRAHRDQRSAGVTPL